MGFTWQNETVAILASGPSLTPDAAFYARNRADRVIAINESWQLCRDADVLYAADSAWWNKRGPDPVWFKGERWSCDMGWHGKPAPAGITLVPCKPGSAITLTGPISTGSNSSFQAMHLAIRWGAKKIVFLGLDMTADNGGHWHRDHGPGLRNTEERTYQNFRRAFETAAPEIAALGVEVVNASPTSALNCFPKIPLWRALP